MITPISIHRPRAANTLNLPRTMHLIDIENLMGGHITETNAKSAWAAYSAAISIKPGDAVFVGCSRYTARKVAFNVPAWVRLLVGGSGPDAADLALLAAVDPSFTARRYQAAVIASADGIFSDLAAELATLGCRVIAAHARSMKCSTRLRLASAEQVLIDSGSGPRGFHGAPHARGA